MPIKSCYSAIFGKESHKNTFHILCDSMPECHLLTPNVTFGSTAPRRVQDGQETDRKNAGRPAGSPWNLRSLLAAALQLVDVVDRLDRGSARRHPEWGPLLEAILNDQRLSTGLAAFANWCTGEGISPYNVNDTAVERFLTWLEARSLYPNPRVLVRRVPVVWNDASKKYDFWPTTKLTRLSFKPPKHLAFASSTPRLLSRSISYLPCRCRPQNLSSLSWQHNFSEPNGPREQLLLHIAASDTKTKRQDIVSEVPNEIAHRLRWYRRHVLPRFGAGVNGYLFVTESGSRKRQGTLTRQITDTIMRHLGIHMTPHQFRHFGATSYLEQHPEDFETARAILGHSSSKTTRIYAGASSRRASRAYNQYLLEQREALKLLCSPRKRRG